MSPELARYLAAWLWMVTLYGFGFATAWALWGLRPAQEPLSCPAAAELGRPVLRTTSTPERVLSPAQTARFQEGQR